MRIGIIIPVFPSYTETFFLSQVKGLCERGHDVTVFCSQKNTDPELENNYQLKQYLNLLVVDLNIKTFGLSGIANILLHPVDFFSGWHKEHSFRKSVYMQLCKVYLKKLHCDIYHFGYTGIAISYLPLLPALKGRTVVSCMGTAENVKPITEPGRIVKMFEVFQAADLIHCVSGHLAGVARQYGAAPQKIFINRPAIDISYFKRKTNYAQHDCIGILSVGRLIFQKGLLNGILVMHSLAKQFPGFKWTIAGDGPGLDELVFHINLFGLNDHIILAGRKTRTEVSELYEHCDIFFLPSISEGIANVVLEAMSMEVPVVAANAGGISEVISSGEDGIVCDVYDHEAMANALYGLCVSYEKRLKMGRNGRKTVEEGYSLERYIDVFEEEYGELVGE